MNSNISTQDVLRLLTDFATNPLETSPIYPLVRDGNENRLGWFLPPSEEEIKVSLNQFFGCPAVVNKRNFIFSGMGGSINTIKAVAKVMEDKSQNRIFTVDSLDPAALEELALEIDAWEETLIVGISKSGGTKETSRILKTLKNVFDQKGLDWKNHFVWLTDLPNRTKIENDGWTGANIFPIQVNQKNDIGGRFTAPHTMIFYIPLFILGGYQEKLLAFWQEYLRLRHEMLVDTVELGIKVANLSKENYVIDMGSKLNEALETWMIQLFQESLGGKMSGFNPKTVIGDECDGFEKISWDIKSEDEIVKAMVCMYLAQVLVATIALVKNINFVTQPEVENYKNKMREVSDGQIPDAFLVNNIKLLEQIGVFLKNHQGINFIEAVCYWYLSDDERIEIKNMLKKEFGDKVALVFVGSDWNHHSYQAASKNENTLFLILTKPKYTTESSIFKKSDVEENIKILKTIAYATYATIKEKSLSLALS